MRKYIAYNIDYEQTLYIPDNRDQNKVIQQYHSLLYKHHVKTVNSKQAEFNKNYQKVYDDMIKELTKILNEAQPKLDHLATLSGQRHADYSATISKTYNPQLKKCYRQFFADLENAWPFKHYRYMNSGIAFAKENQVSKIKMLSRRLEMLKEYRKKITSASFFVQLTRKLYNFESQLITHWDLCQPLFPGCQLIVTEGEEYIFDDIHNDEFEDPKVDIDYYYD